MNTSFGGAGLSFLLSYVGIDAVEHIDPLHWRDGVQTACRGRIPRPLAYKPNR
jgi:hypothetical protein